MAVAVLAEDGRKQVLQNHSVSAIYKCYSANPHISSVDYFGGLRWDDSAAG
jgi:hypothetical protein